MRILGGALKGRVLKAPNGTKTRPTSSLVRRSVFDICAMEVEGASFLDLFAGTGAMGIEALSRGALHATLVERDRDAIVCIRQNLQTMCLQKKTLLLPIDVLQALKRCKGNMYDLIYMDPPYGDHKKVAEVLQAIDQLSLLAPKGLLFLEYGSRDSEEITEILLSGITLRKERSFGDSMLWEFVRS